jgi:hypothetical protein
MTQGVRALAAMAISIAATALPQPSFAGSLPRRTEAAVVDFAKYLPRLDEVPWVDAAASRGHRSHLRLPEAGTAGALLLSPSPARAWPESFHSAAAAPRSVGM